MKYTVEMPDYETVEKMFADPDFMISVLLLYKFEKQKRELAEKQRDEAVSKLSKWTAKQ
jgi:hypothetical protein